MNVEKQFNTDPFGSVELSAGVNSGVELEKMNRFLQRLGFQQTGGNYALPLASPITSVQ